MPSATTGKTMVPLPMVMIPVRVVTNGPPLAAVYARNVSVPPIVASLALIVPPNWGGEVNVAWPPVVGEPPLLIFSVPAI